MRALNPLDSVTDNHPDPLIVSSAYPHPEPGWLYLRAYGTSEQLYMGEWVMEHGPLYHEPLSLPITTVYPEHGAQSALFPAPTYHHPSDEWVREVARQLLTGERKLSYQRRRYAVAPCDVDVCQVTLYRAHPDQHRLHAYTIEEILTSPDCQFLSGKEASA